MGSVIVAHGLSCSTACGIFPDQESNLCPHHCQANYLSLSHQEALVVIIMIAVDIIDCLITSPPSHCNYMRAETVCFFCMIRAWTANTELVLDKYTIHLYFSSFLFYLPMYTISLFNQSKSVKQKSCIYFGFLVANAVNCKMQNCKKYT